MTPEYKRDYNRGWRSSSNYSGSDGMLDRADARGESDAWYDGYYDHAAGREKWETPQACGIEEHEAMARGGA